MCTFFTIVEIEVQSEYSFKTPRVSSYISLITLRGTFDERYKTFETDGRQMNCHKLVSLRANQYWDIINFGTRLVFNYLPFFPIVSTLPTVRLFLYVVYNGFLQAVATQTYYSPFEVA